MKNGFKIFDTDTHVGPNMEVLNKYMSDADKTKLEAWEEYRSKNAEGDTIYLKGVRSYRRRLGETTTDKIGAGYVAGFTGAKKRHPVSPRIDYEPAMRIKDMDLEGADVNFLLPSGWFGTWTTSDDISLELSMYRAYHLWMNDYCSAFPDRLGAALLVSGRDVKGSVEEIRKWAKAKWAWGVLPYAPYGMALDHPDLEPIWAEAQEQDLCIALHTFTAMPPYAPGGTDNWENMFLQRSAAHPWCGMRNMASLIGAGVMDRYPNLRIATLEAGHGWLPFWLARIDEHAKSAASTIPQLKCLPSEYAMSGRYFQSIEVPEGQKITGDVISSVGEDVLMYASDFPHTESHFPDTVNEFLEWDIPLSRKRNLLWNNPLRCYRRAGLT